MADKTKTYVVTKKDGTKTTIKVKEGTLIRVDARKNTKNNIRVYAKNPSNVSAKTTKPEGAVDQVIQEQKSTNMSTQPNQSIATREDLEKGSRQSLLLERRDYESAYLSSIPERKDGTILLPDTAREERIRKRNEQTSDYEKKIKSSKVTESRIQERRKISQEKFLENPNINTAKALGTDLFAESVAETIPAGMRSLRAADLVGRGVTNIGKGVITGETKRGESVSLGKAQLSAARQEVFKEPISAIPALAVEIGAVTVATGNVLRGSRVEKQVFINEKVPKVSTITDVSTGATRTRTVSTGTAYDASVQTFFGRSVVNQARLNPIVRGQTAEGVIISESVSTPNINRAGQVLETAQIESVTTFQTAGGRPKIISTSFGNQRGEIIDELIFDRNVRGGTRAVSYVTAEGVPTGTGSELYTIRGQTITQQGKRTGFLLQEERIISDVGSTRTSVGSVRTIEYPDIKQPIIKPNLRLGKKGQIAISRSGSNNFGVSEPVFDVAPPKVVSASPRFSNLSRSGIISEEIGAARGVGAARVSAYLGVKSLSGTNTLSNSLGANALRTNTLSSTAALNNYLGVSVPEPTVITGTGTSTGVSAINDFVRGGRTIPRINAPSISQVPKIVSPPVVPKINLGSGFSYDPGIKRFKGRLSSGTPPSLTGALLDIGVKTKKGQTYSGLEIRR